MEGQSSYYFLSTEPIKRKARQVGSVLNARGPRSSITPLLTVARLLHSPETVVKRSAQSVYAQIVNPQMLIYLAEAVRIPRPIVSRAAAAALEATDSVILSPHRAPHSRLMSTEVA